MASKPTNKPRFAHDGAAPSGEVLEPSSGKKDVGWEGGEEPGHDYMNWIHSTTYEWIDWLDAAEVDFGTATVRADDMIIDDDLTVTGQVLDDVELAANKHVIVSGTGEYKHGDRVLNIPAALAHGFANFSYNGSNYWASTGLGLLVCPIPLHQGDRIKSITYTRSGDGSADIDLAQISRVTSAGVVTDIGSTTESNPGAIGDTTINVTDTTLGAGDTLCLNFSTNAANIRFYNLRVTYDRP